MTYTCGACGTNLGPATCADHLISAHEPNLQGVDLRYTDDTETAGVYWPVPPGAPPDPPDGDNT